MFLGVKTIIKKKYKSLYCYLIHIIHIHKKIYKCASEVSMSVVQRAFLEKGSLHYKFCTVENGEKNKWTCYLLGSTKYPNNLS